MNNFIFKTSLVLLLTLGLSPLQSHARDFENDGVTFSSKLKMVREAGEDVEIAFESRKGLYTLSHTAKDFEKTKAMFTMAKERNSTVTVVVDSMSDQIISATEIKEKKGPEKKKHESF